jgi:hypothetical protein
VKTVLDKNGNASDLNYGAGGDYIYLLQTRDKQDESSIVASMIGSGSVFVIISFAVISLGVIAWICILQKKRRVKTSAPDEAVNSESQDS